MRTLNFTEVLTNKNGCVREAIARDGDVVFTISRYLPYKSPVLLDGGFGYAYVMDVVDTKAGKAIHNTGVCGVRAIIGYLTALELSMWGIKPVDVQGFGENDMPVDAKVLYADPECSHVRVM
jgi:hypothetical protein